jgi:hypothetical protein
MLKRVQALEAGKRGETAGYQEQNARIGALETQSGLHQQAHNMVHDRLNAQQRRMGEHHKRIGRIEMSMETCVRIGDLQFRKATET